MYSYVGFLDGRLNINNENSFRDTFNGLTGSGESNKPFCGYPSFYAYQDVFSTLTPNDVPQPNGKVITEDMWEDFAGGD